DAVDDARRVAATLDIPYYVPNFREEFADAVVDDFTREYLQGRTPNPCVRCNQFVRFDGLLRRADELGVDYVATGHYARIAYDDHRSEFVLKKAVDERKDQSYMLHTLQQHHLSRILFPLGEITKDRTRAVARELRLPVAEKPDSQEICFVAGKNYKRFLREYGGDIERPGNVVDGDGTILGTHRGVHEFTVGQRKGLGITSDRPRYVVALRPRENQVVVGDREDALADSVICSRLTFTGDQDGSLRSFAAAVKIRYRAREERARVYLQDDRTARVEFDRPVWGAAPGQLAVFYDGDRVIGGGTIDEVLAAR
ncbi:MAG TPA: tRNA 2-thiouridine(34) synthase MnmA, partial [Chloroflexota bacterium]